MTQPAIYLSFDALVSRLCGIFQRLGCSLHTARLLAKNCASAERDGAYSHGLFRIKDYAADLAANDWVAPNASPIIEDVSPGMARVDAQNGFALTALDAAKSLAIAKAQRCGVAIIAIRNSHHLSALSLDVEPFAEAGLVAISFINSSPAVVPYGGHTAALGTNPFAFAAPRSDAPPFVFDMATSVMAHGDVQLAAQKGETLQLGSGVDARGEPTTDPNHILNGGALLPFGAHKGAAISLMVEILCAGLVEGNFSSEVDASSYPGAVTANTGQSLLLIDPSHGSKKSASFAERVSQLIELMKDAGQQRLPGERRLRCRAESARNGVPISAELLALLKSFECV